MEMQTSQGYASINWEGWGSFEGVCYEEVARRPSKHGSECLEGAVRLAVSIPQGIMGLLEVLLEALDVTLPSVDAILNLPDLLGNLPNEPEVMANQHHATVPVCKQEGAFDVVSRKHSDKLRHRRLLTQYMVTGRKKRIKAGAGCWGNLALLDEG